MCIDTKNVEDTAANSAYVGAICEDNLASLNYIKATLEKSFAQNSFPMSLEAYSDPQSLLRNIKFGTHYDVLFLDIDMPKLNGIDLTRQLRNNNIQTKIIFISNKEELVFQTFEVQPLFFLRKNHFLEGLPTLIHTLIKEFQKEKRLVMTVEELHSDNMYSFDLHQLMYVEAIRKYCNFVSTNGKIRVQYRLGSLNDVLSQHSFIQCHRSFIVNCRFIFSLSKTELILDDYTTLPIGRSHYQAVRNAFMNFMYNGE